MVLLSLVPFLSWRMQLVKKKIEQVIIGVAGENLGEASRRIFHYITLCYGEWGGFPTLLSQFENSQILELL